MAAARQDPGSRPDGGVRFFCTAGRGLEPFLMQEVRARLAATQVEYISGKVFFTTSSDLNMLKKLKSAERLFLLIKKQSPFTVSSPRKGKIFNEIQKLINDDPGSWLNTISIWKNLLELDTKKEKLSQRASNPLKRKMGENEIIAKKLKVEEMQKIETTHKECQLEKQIKENALEQRDSVTGQETLQEEGCQNDVGKAVDAHNQDDLTFRVSCRCSGTIGKAFTAQEIGRVIGIALMKQFGWKTDLRTPNLEIFVHLNDIYFVVGIPVFRIPLASRTYIKTAGLRSTIAWAMASLAEIKPGAFVLDPMCGLGTILLEAAKEWPSAYYMGADVSDSQLLGACDNLKAAGLKDKIELLKVSVIELPLPSDSVDIIISDIPFGKKFKLGKDIKSILQEMERVLHVGGTIVLLLNEDHHRLLKDCREGNSPLNSKGSHTHEPEIKKCLNPEENTGTSEMVPSSHETSNNACLNKMSPFGSLVPVEYYKVSLGKTEAFICKYKKSHSSGL
ncbi:THUMP domain containing 2, transcript variant X1 [Ictidomys tridecemlineatus]|uniref:U6 snRNA (guanine-N(2))-methyltransferase THUMPD2 n=2 Tax=Ictidomys tridecemlineatus TaxID=43179 RepID=I3N864_ICTTR|nr:THUMP domain-containing protein 2 isoform X1 [Ictidomys tridecemlineatus]KAG3267419.1 THUMP domain containing 2, transcript variant X1 [Ictidomys tridecemlineatus]